MQKLVDNFGAVPIIIDMSKQTIKGVVVKTWATDSFSGEMPNEVLAKIVEHRPHLKALAERGEHVHLARNYLMGESRLTMHETDRLAAVAAGKAW